MNTLAIGRCKERPQLVGIGTDPGLVDKVGSEGHGTKLGYQSTKTKHLL